VVVKYAGSFGAGAACAAGADAAGGVAGGAASSAKDELPSKTIPTPIIKDIKRRLCFPCSIFPSTFSFLF
jgi:hypothetical protein